MQASRPVWAGHCQALVLARDASWAIEFVLKEIVVFCGLLC